MLALVAVVAFAVAAIDVGAANDFTLPWLVPAGLAFLAAHLVFSIPLAWPRR